MNVSVSNATASNVDATWQAATALHSLNALLAELAPFSQVDALALAFVAQLAENLASLPANISERLLPDTGNLSAAFAALHSSFPASDIKDVSAEQLASLRALDISNPSVAHVR